MSAKSSLPTPEDLSRAILDIQAPKCLVVEWASTHDPDYTAPLVAILFTSVISEPKGVEMLGSLGITIGRTTVGKHRRRECLACNEYFDA